MPPLENISELLVYLLCITAVMMIQTVIGKLMPTALEKNVLASQMLTVLII